MSLYECIIISKELKNIMFFKAVNDMDESKTDKIQRVLGIYSKLMKGNVVNKAEEAICYGVNERSIQRDIDDIRSFLEINNLNSGVVNTVVYEHKSKGYRLDKMDKCQFSNGEILAVCKILLESRAFTKKSMSELIDKLIECCAPEKNKKEIFDLIRNEKFHYVEPRHKNMFIDKIWNIGQAIRNYQCIEIDYLRTKDNKIVKRKVYPVAIMFSEFYFYLTAFIGDKEVRKDFDVINDSYPTIYRIDRIRDMKLLNEKFHIPYSSRFEEGEFRKRVQFMYGGKLRKVKFKYFGVDVNAVLDRLPTAKIISEEDGIYTIIAEVFGDGIDMWLRSQGENIEVIAER